MGKRSLQDTWAPSSICFGCGPANDKGLRIKSFVDNDTLVCDWTPAPHHEAFPGVLNGGIIGTILDCHGNWTAIWHLQQRRGADVPGITVTSEYAVAMRRVTPTDGPLHLVARVVEATDDRATVEATVEARGKITATCRGVFIAAPAGHPAEVAWRQALADRGKAP